MPRWSRMITNKDVEEKMYYMSKDLTAIKSALAYLASQTAGTPQSAALTAYQALGSEMKALPLFGSLSQVNTGGVMVDRSIRLIPVNLLSNETITGINYLISIAGDYTADAYNGVGLYTYSAGIYTLVASSTNDGDIWKGTINTFHSKVFTTPYNAVKGLYYVAMLWCRSAVVAVPQIACGPSNGGFTATASADFTNGAKTISILAGQTSFPATITASATAVSATNIFAALY